VAQLLALINRTRLLVLLYGI